MSLLSPNEDDDDNINQDTVFNDQDWVAALVVPPNTLPTHVLLGNRNIELTTIGRQLIIIILADEIILILLNRVERL